MKPNDELKGAATVLPSDHPMMTAWMEYRVTADYANSLAWCAHPEHREGSLWGAFTAGYVFSHVDGETSEPVASEAPLPDWVAGVINRRGTVENALRAPLIAQKKGLPMPEGFPLTAEAMNELANKLSVPDEFGVKS